MKKQAIWIPLGYLLLILIWGSTWIAIKVSVGDAPFMMASLRFFIAGLVLILFQIVRGKPIFPDSTDRKVILSLGFGNFFLGYGLTYWGMQFVNSNITSILWALLPVMIALFAHGMLATERINAASVFSLLGSLLGTYFIFDLHTESFDPAVAKGMVMIILSVLAAAYPNVLFKRDGAHIDPVAANAAAMLMGAVLLLMVGLTADPWQNMQLSPLAVGATIYLAVIGSAVGFSLYFWLMKSVTVVKMSYSTFLIPILASFWGWILLDERLTDSALLGGAIILLSVSLPELFKSRQHKNKHVE